VSIPVVKFEVFDEGVEEDEKADGVDGTEKVDVGPDM